MRNARNRGISLKPVDPGEAEGGESAPIGVAPGVAAGEDGDAFARRIAYLTRNNDFRRERPDFAVVTGPLDAVDPLRPALARYGLEEVAAF